GRAMIARLRGGLDHRAHVHQLRRLDPACRMDGLRAIAAILRAAAGLDREQGGQLHLVRRVEAPVDGLRLEEEVEEREVEKRRDFLVRPVGAPPLLGPIARRGGADICARAVHSTASPASSLGGRLWPSSCSTSPAAATRLVPGPKIAWTPASRRNW